MLGGGSDAFNPDALSVRGECFKVAWIGSEHGPVWFGDRDDQRVDGGASTGTSAQESRPSGEWLDHLLHDVAGLEKLVLGGVTPGVPLETLHEDDGGNQGRPQARFSKRQE